VLITDRGRSYEAQALAGVRQQKCVAHLQRSLSAALEGQWGRARCLALGLREALEEAVALWTAYQRGEATNFAAQRDRLQARLDKLLAPRRTRNVVNQRLLDELGWHHQQGNLLRFLFEPETVEPTNNRAERALRPAVIARKVSQCSKNERGAAAHAAFASLFVSLGQRQPESVVETALAVLRGGALPEPA